MLGNKLENTPVEEILKVAEAVKLSEGSADLDFKTGYKLARLGDYVTSIVKSHEKQRKRLVEEYNATAKGPDEMNKLNKDLGELNETLEVLYMPEFKLSEFVYDKGENKGKLKVPQKFLNNMIKYIEDDLVKYGEQK